MKLTLAYITSRNEPRFDWFFDSLRNELRSTEAKNSVDVIVVDGNEARTDALVNRGHFSYPDTVTDFRVGHVRPKPTIWQGKYRVTKDDWWAAANARNTALMLCRTEWIMFFDDRCVVLPGWWRWVRDAMKNNYALCGAYEKRTNMTVENGVIRNAGIITGQDSREDYVRKYNMMQPMGCPGDWMWGCCFALPLEWALAVGGQPEITHGLGMDDTLFGLLIQNNGYTVKYNANVKIIEDRTPEFCVPTMKRTDKGVSPQDKSHAVLDMFLPAKGNAKHAKNGYDIRAVRQSVLAGNPFPSPNEPLADFWDGQPIKEFV